MARSSFPAFEWTSSPGNRNLHRVVVFKDSRILPELPYSTLDSNKPEDLWRYMDAARERGATLLAIPHNGNASDGLMFSGVDSQGNALDADYARTKMRNEPLYEISQIKGTSETHPELSPNDEFAGFELWQYTLSALTERNTVQQGSYLRRAYRDGLKMDAAGRGNPFKYGIIGDSDSHNSAASIEEDNYSGKFGMENNPKHRLMGPLPMESNNKQVREFSSGSRKLDANGNAPAVGNTVDAKSASYRNSIGDTELKAVWQDPDFDAKAHAFYYARVIEIPTPRWSTYDAKALGMAPRDDLPVSIQERAWTSPIWYTP